MKRLLFGVLSLFLLGSCGYMDVVHTIENPVSWFSNAAVSKATRTPLSSIPCGWYDPALRTPFAARECGYDVRLVPHEQGHGVALFLGLNDGPFAPHPAVWDGLGVDLGQEYAADTLMAIYLHATTGRWYPGFYIAPTKLMIDTAMAVLKAKGVTLP